MKWPQVKLKDVFTIARGGSPRPIASFITNEPDGLNWISIKDASNSDKYIYKTKLKIKKEGLIKSRFVKPGDFLLTNSMSFGRPYIMKTSGCIHDGWLVLSSDSKKVDQDYFYFLLGSPTLHNKFKSLAAGAVVKNLNIDLVKGVKVPLPTLPDQKKIAAILDAADAYRQKTKALIAKYDELTQSLFLDMFGDPVINPMGLKKTKLGELLEITSSKRIFKNEYVDFGIPFFRTKEIVELSKGNKISLELFISEQRFNEIKSKFDLPKVGDILLSAVGTIGVMWVVNTKEPFYFKDGNLVWLKTSLVKNLNSTYLKMTLEYLIEYEKYKLAEGGAYNALTIAKLKNFTVLMAPYHIQNQFAERVQVIEEQKSQAQASLEKSEDLFNCLLQKAFKGELTT